ILWSDDTTHFAGRITARGPGGAGTGGFVEVSGKGRLDFYGMVDTNGGTLLLDPNSITISTAASSSFSESGTTPNLQVTHMGSADSILNVTYLVNTLLASNNVTLLANNFITVDAAVTSGSGFDLILNAPTLNLNAPINLTNITSSLSGNATLVNVGALGKIQNGVDAVGSGGQVNVAAGTFYENVRIIGKALTLTGSGSGVTIVNGNADKSIDGSGDGTVFFISAGGQTVTLDSLTITNGRGNSGSQNFGGGVYNNGGTVAISNSTISGNSASGSFSAGGGIYNNSGTVEITNSTISGNSSSSTTFSSYGGGIYNNGGATVEINNSTISGNSASSTSYYADGGGIFNMGGTVEITNSTISGNSASSPFDSYGGGIYIYSGTVMITNSIIALNTAGYGPNVFGYVSDLGYNLVGSTAGSTGFTGTGTQIDVADTNVGLAPLGNYGGPTQTHALLVGSFALRSAPGAATGSDQRGQNVTDGARDVGAFEAQTSGSYVVTNTKDNTAGDIVGSLRHGIGLSNGTIALAEKITTIIFNIPVADAGYNSTAGVWTITGTANFVVTSGVTIDGTTQPGYVAGGSPVIVVNGNQQGTVFRIDAGGQTASLNALTITNGKSNAGGGVYVTSGTTVKITSSTISGNSASSNTSSGGGIYNAGTVEITNSTVSGNSASGTYSDGGGGIFNNGGTVKINNSTISGNSASGTSYSYGGGIRNNNGTVEITNSTVSGNFNSSGLYAYGGGILNGSGTVKITNSTISGNFNSSALYEYGGGIYNGGTLEIANSTISGNSSSPSSFSYGGGIYNIGGTVTIAHSIIALNTAETGP
ncbi:MAG TPA: right-handed parallel beta-helix repeat-containing protein, partial [Roseimicrobium sp.]|nr:right-handed parallel beta-helix repeat-containing protein [Roseimicrobium sp.]